jgi:acetyl-CoA synthase
MSKIIATAAIRGAHKYFTQAEENLNKAIQSYGESQKLEFPNTAYWLPLIYALTGMKVRNLKDAKQSLEIAKKLLSLIPSDKTWLPYLGDTLDAGIATLISQEIIEALKYLKGNPYEGIWLGFTDDATLRMQGIKLVDGRMPGFAAVVGAAPTNEDAVRLVRELQEKSILVFMASTAGGKSFAEQLAEEGIEMNWDTFLVPYGKDTSSAVFALNFACRAAMTFGGITPKGIEEARKILFYNLERVYAFVLALGKDNKVSEEQVISDEKYATAAGAINFGFPVISNVNIPEIRPTGICKYEHVIANIPLEKIVAKAIEVRGLKIKVTKMPIPVPYGAGFEGERVRKPQMWVELGGRNNLGLELLRMKNMEEVEDGKIELIGPDIDAVSPRSSLPFALVVDVAGRKMQKDFENVLERHIHHFLSCANGIMHTGQRILLWHRISEEAYQKGLRLKHLGKIVELKLKDEFSAIVDKVQVLIATDEEKIKELIKEAEPIFKERDERIMGMTDEEVDTYYSCTLCQSYAPNHVCVVSPERLGLCGAYTWLDCKASHEMNPKGANQPIKKGNVLDSIRGEWEGVNKFVYEKSNRAFGRFHHYSIMSYPETSCCIGDTNLIIDGEMFTFREFSDMFWGTDKYRGKKCLTLKDDYKNAQDKIIALQKFKAPKELIRIRTKTGLELIVTSDHKIPIDTPDGICWLKAKELKIGDRVFTFKKLDLPAKIPQIYNLLPDDLRTRGKGLIKLAKFFIKERYGTIKEGSKKLNISFHPRKDSLSFREIRKLIKNGLCRDELYSKIEEVGTNANFYKLDKQIISKQFFYLLGLIASDGSLIRRGRYEYKICFINTQPELIDVFSSIYHRLFPTGKIWIQEKKELRIPKIKGRKIKSQKSCYQIQINNFLLGFLAEWFGLGVDKHNHNFKRLFALPEDFIAGFIAGVFDGDGSVRVRKYKEKWDHCEIYIPVERKDVALKFSLLLRRLDIVSYIKKSNNIFKLYIYSDNAYRFSIAISSKHPSKSERLKIIKYKWVSKTKLTKSQTNILPYLVGKIISQDSDKSKYLAPTTSFYYSHFKSRPILKNILAMPKITLSPIIKKFMNADLMLDTIKVIERFPNTSYDYVYNLTLSDLHSYFASGFWIANCGCFECIIAVAPEANGVMIVNREYSGETPLGMTFSTLAGSVGGGNQVPGFLGIGKLFITSKKFIKADGGIKRIVWMPKQLKEEIKDRFEKRAKEESVPDLLDKIADETNAMTLEELLEFLKKVNHPALTMSPIMETA